MLLLYRNVYTNEANTCDPFQIRVYRGDPANQRPRNNYKPEIASLPSPNSERHPSPHDKYVSFEPTFAQFVSTCTYLIDGIHTFARVIEYDFQKYSPFSFS